MAPFKIINLKADFTGIEDSLDRIASCLELIVQREYGVTSDVTDFSFDPLDDPSRPPETFTTDEEEDAIAELREHIEKTGRLG